MLSSIAHNQKYRKVGRTQYCQKTHKQKQNKMMDKNVSEHAQFSTKLKLNIKKGQGA
jgi:hypothetical protein